VGSALEPGAVTSPVVEDAEAVRSVHFAELHLHAVVGIAVGGEDVQTAAARGTQLLRDDTHVAQAQPGGISGKPVLQPDLVIPQIPQPRWLPDAHRKSLLKGGHNHHPNDEQ
jgi:hypothetical protein